MDDDRLPALDTWPDLSAEDPVMRSLAGLEEAVHERGVELRARRCRSDPPPQPPPAPAMAA